MTETARQRDRGEMLWRRPTRREVIAGGIGFVASLTVDQLAERNVIDPMLETAPRSMACSDLKSERFDALASIEMQGALMLWQQGRREFPHVIAERQTRTYRGTDGRRWMHRQGHRIRLFGNTPLREQNIPMAAQPDGELGEWAERRLDGCELGSEPVFQKCRVLVNTDEGLVPKTWLALLLPWEDGVVDSVTELV